MRRIAILGAGQADTRMAAALDEEGHRNKSLLLGEEPAPPHQRPPLSDSCLLGQMARERLHQRAVAWSVKRGIILRLGWPPPPPRWRSTP